MADDTYPDDNATAILNDTNATYDYYPYIKVPAYMIAAAVQHLQPAGRVQRRRRQRHL